MNKLRIYKTRGLADVAIMRFYSENKEHIAKVFPAYKSRGVLLKGGTKIYFSFPDAASKKKLELFEVSYH